MIKVSSDPEMVSNLFYLLTIMFFAYESEGNNHNMYSINYQMKVKIYSLPLPELKNHTAEYQNNQEKENTQTDNYSKHYGKLVFFLVFYMGLEINMRMIIESTNYCKVKL